MGDAIGDITAGELLELLADDEMIESGYDREGMVALLLLCRAGLQVLCGQIDGLRAELDAGYEVRGYWSDGDEQPGLPCKIRLTRVADGEPPSVSINLDARPLLEETFRHWLGTRLSVWATWPDGAHLPDECGLSDSDGDPIDVELDCSGLIEEVRRRVGPSALASTLVAPNRAAAIRAEHWLGTRDRVLRAAEALADEIRTGDEGYGVSPGRREQELIDAVAAWRKPSAQPKRCGTCARWDREAEPVASARPCALGPELPPRTAESSCPDGWQSLDDAEADTDPVPQLPGVTVDGNVIRSEGSGDV